MPVKAHFCALFASLSIAQKPHKWTQKRPLPRVLVKYGKVIFPSGRPWKQISTKLKNQTGKFDFCPNFVYNRIEKRMAYYIVPSLIYK